MVAINLRNVVPVEVVEKVQDPDHGDQGEVQFANEALFMAPVLLLSKRGLVVDTLSLGGRGLFVKFAHCCTCFDDHVSESRSDVEVKIERLRMFVIFVDAKAPPFIKNLDP
jgi:hypothetical protein